MFRRVSLNLLFLNMQLVHKFRLAPPMDNGNNSLHAQVPYLLGKRGRILGLIALRERGRDFSPGQTNNKDPRIRKNGYKRVS